MENQLPGLTKEEVNKRGKNGCTPLVVAVANGALETAKFLLETLGAEVNTRFGALGDTPLHLAIEREDEFMVELLLLHGADYKALNKNLQTPIAFTNERQRKRHNLLTQASHVLTLDTFNK